MEGASRMKRGLVGWVGGLVLLTAASSPAQSNPPLPRLMNEGMVNGRFARSNAIELGWSLIVPMSPYIRTHLTAAGGYIRRDQLSMRESRYEGSIRFLLDPFRQARYGLSFGAGAGMTNSDGLFGPPNPFGERFQTWRPFLVAYTDLELRKSAGLTPALQLGIGSGIRFGLLVRSATNRWR
jgi:hypothetical protein